MNAMKAGAPNGLEAGKADAPRDPRSRKSDGERALVILPTYNEAQAIRETIAAVLAQGDRFSVLVVDDASPDGTGQAADEIAAAESRVHVLHREGKLGLGSAYLDGFRWALQRDFGRIFEMDADGSHDPRYLPKLLAAAEELDLVIGSRYVRGVNVIDWPMSRLLLSYYANKYARLATGLRLADATSGFRCFRRGVLEALDLGAVGSTGYTFQIEVAFLAWKKGFRVGEIPIVFTGRYLGESKMSGRIIFEAVWRVWALRVRSIAGRL